MLGLLALCGWTGAWAQGGAAAPASGDYVLGAGDLIRVSVFQQPDLSLDARISESGMVSYPLIGNVSLGGLTGTQAEKEIAGRLASGRFLQNPQVSVNVLEYRSQQVSVLGAVNKPGRYPLELSGTRLSEVLAQAGGIVTGVGSETVNLLTSRNGQAVTLQIDLADIFVNGEVGKDEILQAGDAIYVHRAPAYYVYGQVQRPGMYAIERGMTVAQAIAKAGGLTARGTERGLKLQRRNARGEIEIIEVQPGDPLLSDDLLQVRESLF
ncbi:MAG TPA: polysaccharide export protein EpsE [Burkholderiaceae bacterium]|nr:polysaccharide export protein EpsE [Burkholderiaceae bacterium]